MILSLTVNCKSLQGKIEKSENKIVMYVMW